MKKLLYLAILPAVIGITNLYWLTYRYVWFGVSIEQDRVGILVLATILSIVIAVPVTIFLFDKSND